jgi:hypothetical protein
MGAKPFSSYCFQNKALPARHGQETGPLRGDSAGHRTAPCRPALYQDLFSGDDSRPTATTVRPPHPPDDAWLALALVTGEVDLATTSAATCGGGMDRVGDARRPARGWWNSAWSARCLRLMWTRTFLGNYLAELLPVVSRDEGETKCFEFQ